MTSQETQEIIRNQGGCNTAIPALLLQLECVPSKLQTLSVNMTVKEVGPSKGDKVMRAPPFVSVTFSLL